MLTSCTYATYTYTAHSSIPHYSTSYPTHTGSLGPNLRQTDKIEVRECASSGVFLAGHNLRVPVTSAQEAFMLVARGNKVRATAATNCNDVSSRYVGGW